MDPSEKPDLPDPLAQPMALRVPRAIQDPQVRALQVLPELA